MKNLLSKIALVALSAAVFMFAGCDEMKNKSFSLSIKEVGPEYVELNVQGGDVIRMAYMVDEREMRVENPQQIFKKGTEVTCKGGEVLRISLGLLENTQYYIYACAALSETEFSEIIVLPFKTTAYSLSELITVVDQYHDGYKMRVTLPKETKERGNAIRWNTCCVMMYNYMKESSDDYYELLYNGGNYTVKDTTLIYSEENNWYLTGEDSDGDGEIDWDVLYNPISPGEPVVFTAAEFAWMDKNQDVGYWSFPAGWEAGYYMPVLDSTYYTGGKQQSGMGILDSSHMASPMDEFWEGAHQRKHFRVKEPALMEAGVDVKLAKATPVNLTLEFYPDEGVDQYAFGIFDDDMYQNQVLPLLNGNEDWMQWAVTSYFAAYTFGTKVASGAVQADLTSFYYQSAIAPETTYHVFVTAMGDALGTTQSFRKFSFETTAKVKDAPEVEVKALASETGPYVAAFNIKCTTHADNPLTEAYYAANYIRDWRLEINSGSTYFGLVNGNNAFSAEELSHINSDAGYTIYIPSIDGETTRLVVVGYNDEYTPNNVSGYKFIEDCPAAADCTTPYVDPKPYVDVNLYADLVGDWTATALLTDSEGKKTFEHSSKITLAADLYDYPASLTEEVYDIYEKESEYDREEVDAMWYEFKQLAEEITVERLENQNRLVGIGWLDDDSYNRLTARTPYDLFIATDYTSVDVSSLYNDYGPKWYLETSKDENGNVVYSVPLDYTCLPPASNWSVPFYLGAMQRDTWYTVLEGDGWDASFPVTVSEDRNTITIHPLVLSDGTEMYPNMIGIDSTMGTLLENPVISEIVLTRGWSGDDKEQSSVRGAAQSVKAHGDFPKGTYKRMTKLVAPEELKKIEVEIPTKEQFKERADKLVERFVNKNNR